MNKFLENLKEKATKQPLEVIAVATGVITAIAQVSKAVNASRNSVAWHKVVKRRVNNSK